MLSTEMRRIAHLLSLAVLLLVAAPLARAANDTCNLLTTAEISAATSDPVTTTSPGPSNCIWRGKDSGIYLTIRDGAAWKNGKSMFIASGHAQPVSGVGDDAFFADMGSQPWLYALKGSHFIIIHLNVTKFSAGQAQSALKSLANEALSRL